MPPVVVALFGVIIAGVALWTAVVWFVAVAIANITYLY